MSKLHITIDEVIPESSASPLIVNFQNGYTTDKFTTKPCHLYRNKDTGEKTVLSEMCGLLYAGKEEKEELDRTLILVRNRITGKARLIESGTVDMKPQIQSKTETPAAVLETSSLELSRKFGSKKNKKYMEQREKLRVNKDAVETQMHNVTVNIAEDQLDLSTYTRKDNDDFYIPSINRTATTVEEVYDLYKILTKEEYDKIYSEINDKNFTADMVPWIKDLITKKTASKELTVLALYASSLVNLYFTMTKEITKKAFVSCQHSGTLDKIILNNFTTMSNNRRNRSMQMKDKSFCHVIVFLLLINNYKYDADELCRHLKVTIRTLNTKIRVIGATMVKNSNKNIVQLKLPLSNPVHSRRKSARF